MVRFTDILNELFDMDVKYEWTYLGGVNNVYTFKTDGGVEYTVSFRPYSDFPGAYERDYKPTKGRHTDMTGEGHPLTVGATVMDITNDFLKKKKNFKKLVISPISDKRLTIVKNFLEKHLDSKFFYDILDEEGVIEIYKKAK